MAEMISELLVRVRHMCADGTARRIRTESGLSLREIGRDIGASEQTVWKWEMGRNAPHGDPALLYVDLLDRLAGPPVGRHFKREKANG